MARRLAALLGMCLSAAAHAEPVTLLRDVVLRAEPSVSASEVVKVAKGVQGESLERNGAWVRIRTAQGTGWLFSFDVRFGERAAASAGSTASALANLFAPRPQRQLSVTGTIGIRGLSEDELRKAPFNQRELERLHTFQVTREQGDERASRIGLQPLELPYLEEPRAAPFGNPDAPLSQSAPTS